MDNLNNGIISIAKSIVNVGDIFSKGNFNSVIPSSYIQSMSENIRAYVDLIDYLQSKNIGPLSFITTYGIAHGLSKLSDGYDKLSKSVKSLSNSLNTLDISKLDSLKSLTNGIVLLSLMDSEQYIKMMDAIEAKTGIYVKLLEEVDDATTSKNKSIGTLNTVKSSSNTKGATTDDVLGALVSIDLKMGKIVTACKGFVSYIDELRTGNNSIKSRKHMQ